MPAKVGTRSSYAKPHTINVCQTPSLLCKGKYPPVKNEVLMLGNL